VKTLSFAERTCTKKHFLSAERTCTKKHFSGQLVGVPAGTDPFGQLWGGFDPAVSGCSRLRVPEPEQAVSLSSPPLAAACRIFAPSPPNPPLNATALG